MVTASAAAGTAIGQNLFASISSALTTIAGVKPAAFAHGGGGGFGPAGPTEPGITRPTKATTLPSLASATVAKGFTLPFNLQLEQARADASGSQAAILKAARDIASFVRAIIPRLSGDKLIGAYQELATVNSTIAAAVKAAADKAKAFTVPLTLQVQQAKFDALGNTGGLKIVLEKIRATAEKALKSMKLGLQGQLDAWNTIKSVNDQLKNLANGTQLAFKEANTKAFVQGLGLTADQAKALRARISQLSPGGLVPGQGVGAFGVDITVNSNVNLDGKKVASNTTKHQQRAQRRNPPQRRGPHAGLAGGI